jgi:hypothetical protein
MLYSSRWATSTVAVQPVRVFDTRNPASRRTSSPGRRDRQRRGRQGGATIVISLARLWTWVRRCTNLTVTKTKGRLRDGLGSGPRPTASTVNWWTSGQTLANAVLSPLGPWGRHNSTIAVFCSAGTAILMDLTGFEVAAPWQVLTDKPGTALARPEQSSAGRLAQRAPVEPLQA